MLSAKMCCQEFLLSIFFISYMIFTPAGERILATVPNINVQLSGVLFMEVVRPSMINYTYKIRLAKNFGTDFSRKYNNMDLVLAEPLHGCSTLTNADFINDKIAFILRGECSFVTKAKHAEEAGAMAVVISDNDVHNAQNFVDMVDDGTERQVYIPTVFVLGKDGYMIRNALDRMGMQSAIVNIPINITGSSIYQVSQPPWTLW